VSVLSNFKGLDTNDAGGAVEPPDPIAAAGPTTIGEVVNSNVEFYSKTTKTPVSGASLDVFFQSVDPTPFLLSDVYVAYDESVGRFLVATMDIDFTNLQSFFDFAVSNDSDPTHGFTDMHRIETTEVSHQTGETLFTDFPRVGWNADAYVVTFNMTGFLTQNPYNVQVLTINKASVTDQNASTLTYFQADRPMPNSTMVPATMHGALPGAPMWFVEEKGIEQNGDYNNLRVVEMTNVLSNTPTFTDFYVPVASYTITPFPNDTNGQVSTTLDTRILSADWRKGMLVACQNVGVSTDTTPTVHARWYELNLAGTAPALLQQGTISPGDGIDTYMPSAALMDNGTIGMTYIESSFAENMSMYVTGRTTADAAGTMETPALVKAGEDFYQGTRIGDFSGITVDPATGSSFWAANEYAIVRDPIDPTLPNWGTWMGNFTVTSSLTGTTAAAKSSVQPSVYGQPVTFTATVRPKSAGPGVPTGTVTFEDFGATLGTGTLNSTGHATFSTASLARGNHAITVVYGGDSGFSGSTSGPWGQTVNKDATSTALAAPSTSSVFGQSLTFTATVSANPPGAGTPAGLVIFKDGTTTLASQMLKVVSGMDEAVFSTRALAVGSHTITASYNGSVSFFGSASGAASDSVNPDATTSVVNASVSPSIVGQAVTFTARVRASLPGSGIATGTVTFKDFSKILGTATLTSAAQATFSTSSLSLGNHSITVVYGGDGNFTGSTSPAYGQAVKAAAGTPLLNFIQHQSTQPAQGLSPAASTEGVASKTTQQYSIRAMRPDDILATVRTSSHRLAAGGRKASASFDPDLTGI
jgi:hypothetical protein